MIAVIDYKRGNLRSVQKALERMGGDAVITSDPALIKEADAVVLPGVGAFGDCLRNLEELGLVNPVLDAITSNKPFLGICLGLQLLFQESEEFGKTPGLGVIKGRVVKFENMNGLKIPHMGWNSIKKVSHSPLLNEVENGSYFYFVHSYYVVPEDENLIATKTTYGPVEFTSMIQRNNLWATQFHPEKSQKVGLRVFKNFINMVGS